MTSYDREPADFQELVSWACWKFIEGLTKGEPLRVTVFCILDYARRWKPAANPTPSQGTETKE